MKRTELIDQVAAWIDTRVIAELVVSHCKETEEEATFEGCKEIWLGTLENLGASGLAIHRATRR